MRDGSLLDEDENHEDSPSSALIVPSDQSSEFRHRRSSSKWNDELSPAGSTVTESTQVIFHALALPSDHTVEF